MNRLLMIAACAGFAASAGVAHAGGDNVETFFLTMTGAQEVPPTTDPDGIATGSLTINATTGVVSWDFMFMDLENVMEASDLTGFHIHFGQAGTNGPVIVDLGTDTSGAFGTLIDSTMANTELLSMILGDPSFYYINLHTKEFLDGAVRAQIPTPGTAAPIIGAMLLMARRRR